MINHYAYYAEHSELRAAQQQLRRLDQLAWRSFPLANECAGHRSEPAAEAYPPALPLWDKLGAQNAAKRRCPIQKEDGGRQAGKELISDA